MLLSALLLETPATSALDHPLTAGGVIMALLGLLGLLVRHVLEKPKTPAPAKPDASDEDLAAFIRDVREIKRTVRGIEELLNEQADINEDFIGHKRSTAKQIAKLRSLLSEEESSRREQALGFSETLRLHARHLNRLIRRVFPAADLPDLPTDGAPADDYHTDA